MKEELEDLLGLLFAWGYECGTSQIMGTAPDYNKKEMLNTTDTLTSIINLVDKEKLQLIRDIKNSEGYGKMPVGMRDLLSDMSDEINKDLQRAKLKGDK